jgi:hypothetical protein
MTVLTMRRIRDHFVVTGPDIEPVTFKTRVEARDWSGVIVILRVRTTNSSSLFDMAYSPQSSSASRRTVSHVGFFVLSQSRVRPHDG